MIVLFNDVQLSIIYHCVVGSIRKIRKSEIRPIVKEIVKFRDGSLENSTQEPAKSWSTSKVPLGLSSPAGTSQMIV